MRNRVIGLVTIMSFIFISLIYTTTAFAQSNPISILQSPQQQQQQQSSFCKLTESDMLGPFYKENAPFKQRLGEGVEGERLIITGKVMDMRCHPIKDVILDVWQANSTGEYDNEGFTLRGKVKTDNDGNYAIDTIVPKEYSQGDITRPGHIHLKVGAPNQPTLTTQLYFEGDPYLTNHEKQKPSLIMKVKDENGTKKADFDFVIEHYNEYNK
jgi:protocatechuate 3,4-dioxygenase beta subunit